MRAEEQLVLAFGEIFHDHEGKAWVFIGWRTNTAGRFPVFVRELVGEMTIGIWEPSTYYASMTKTLISKFPDLVRKLKGK